MNTEERFLRIEGILERMVDRQEQQDDTLSTLTESHIKTQEQLQSLGTMVRSLGVTVESLVVQTASLERQWQAYINTLRPQ